MLSDKLTKELNIQIGRELESAYLYFAMAGYCKSISMDGFEHWMLLQAQEEMAHAMKIYRFINDRGGRVLPPALPQPRSNFNSLQEMFETALINEQDLDQKLNLLASSALAEKDNTTYTFLEWFLTEQVEEVSSCTTILDKIKLIGNAGYGLLMLNDELAKRQPEPEETPA